MNVVGKWIKEHERKRGLQVIILRTRDGTAAAGGSLDVGGYPLSSPGFGHSLPGSTVVCQASSAHLGFSP